MELSEQAEMLSQKLPAWFAHSVRHFVGFSRRLASDVRSDCLTEEELTLLKVEIEVVRVMDCWRINGPKI